MSTLDVLSRPRTPECPSDLILSDLQAALLEGETRARVSAHVGECEHCRTWLDDAVTAFEAIPAAERSAMVTRIYEGQAKARRSHWRRGLAMAAGLAAAAVLVFVTNDPTQGPDTRRKGGDLSLRIYRERGGEVVTALNGEEFRAGDRLRFEVDVPSDGHLMLLGVEESGRTFRGYPNGSDQSVPVSSGGTQLLPEAIELDESRGHEAVHLILCDQPFERSEVRAVTPDSVSAPPGCRTKTFKMDKRSR